MQRFKMFYWLILGLVVNPVQANHYQAAMDQSQWLVSSHLLSCHMSQEIPGFGSAYFEQPAGESLQFYLASHQHVMLKGKASLRSLAPVWNPTIEGREFGLIDVQSGSRPIQLEAELALQLLNELYIGRTPQFLRRAIGIHSTAEPESVEVGLSAVNFRSSFASYQQCLEQLMPVTLSELSRSRLLFLPNESSLNEASLAWLATLVEFIKRDDQLESVFIDGYTDNSHSARYNQGLSKRRAEAVQDFFLQQGVSADLILLRFHGERFPIASNENPEGREQNRRVTIRLQRQTPRFAQR
tara:strand:- start:2472 stop:3365 length:894 start_codon:yes stop_codon:yes gene_type:complete